MMEESYEDWKKVQIRLFERSDWKWNDETFTWEIDGSTWNPLTKDWEKI
jgi:hypothetical protein